MSLKVRRYRGQSKVFEYDIRLTLAGGGEFRERKRIKVCSSESAARRWAEARYAKVLADVSKGKSDGKEVQEKVEVPTLAKFAPRFIERYAEVNNKPSEVAAKRSIIDNHLKKRFGRKRLDEITTEQAERMKADLLKAKRSKKTINNALAVLLKMLRVAVDWEVIPRVRVKTKPFKVPRRKPRFYEPEQLDALLKIAPEVDPRLPLFILLGVDAGMRLGEILALEQTSVDFRRHKIDIVKSTWQGFEGTTKGEDEESLKMTPRLEAALQAHRHLRGKYVLCNSDGTPLDRNAIKRMMASAQRRVGLRATGGVHLLRHTFCSRLGAREKNNPWAIMEAARHKDIATTMRYVHQFRGATDSVIDSLSEPEPSQTRGEMLEKVPGRSGT